jgi:hypothetical protein
VALPTFLFKQRTRHHPLRIESKIFFAQRLRMSYQPCRDRGERQGSARPSNNTSGRSSVAPGTMTYTQETPSMTSTYHNAPGQYGTQNGYTIGRNTVLSMVATIKNTEAPSHSLYLIKLTSTLLFRRTIRTSPNSQMMTSTCGLSSTSQRWHPCSKSQEIDSFLHTDSHIRIFGLQTPASASTTWLC